MNIGILGSGDVGQTLASGFLQHGHAVMIGTRDAAKLADWLKANPRGSVGTFSETGAFGDVIVLAVKGSVAAEAIHAAGGEKLAKKTVIDATNPIADAPPKDGVLKFFTNLDESLMEKLQTEFPAVHFVKAFNSVGAGRMVNPQFKGGKPTMFICGDDSGAKATVTTLLNQFGWETSDMGTAVAARAIEPLCILWCIPGFARNEWTHAFKLLRE